MYGLKNKIHTALAVLLLLAGCAEVDDFNGKTPIAKVYDDYLFFEDLGEFAPKNNADGDSLKKIQNFIDLWAKQLLMVKKAELNLDEEQKNVQKQLDEYRNRLLIYKYQEKFIESRRDCLVVDGAEIMEYYKNNSNSFKLNSPLVKAVFVLVPNEQVVIRTAKKLLDYRNEEDSLSFLLFASEKALKSGDYGGQWITLGQLCKDLPFVISERNDALKTRGIISDDGDDDDVWLVKIRDYLPVGTDMPFETAESTIEQIIFNKKKTNLLGELESSIFQKAQGDKTFTYLIKELEKKDKEK
jgi:hypothetical protein